MGTKGLLIQLFIGGQNHIFSTIFRNLASEFCGKEKPSHLPPFLSPSNFWLAYNINWLNVHTQGKKKIKEKKLTASSSFIGCSRCIQSHFRLPWFELQVFMWDGFDIGEDVQWSRVGFSFF